MERYIPRPIDTSNVELPAELEPLMEAIAKNVHDVWAQNRIDDGWDYGPERDDTNKKHPGLVAYEKLDESEKEYDRATALETLKLIIKLGFKITYNDTEVKDN